MENRSWMRKYMAALVGGRITQAGVTKDGWPYFNVSVRVPGMGEVSFKVEVSQDPEGNGPGFLFGLPDPE